MFHRNDSGISRREVLQAGLLASIGATIPGSLLAAGRKLPVIYKRIPSTGQKLPVIGLGFDELGVQGDFSALPAMLKRMYEEGATVIDTAPRYGVSEIQIGKALSQLGIRKKMFVATKFNAPGVGVTPRDPPVSGGQASIELSLQRLQKIDLMFIHNIESVEPMMPLLQELKQQRRVRYIGITNVPRPQQYPRLAGYLRKYPLDFVQVAYSMGERDAEAEILPLARERKIAVMAAHPLGRESLLKQVAGLKLPEWAAEYDIGSWAQFLLKYVVSHPDITCAIPGTTKLEHLVDDLGAGQGRLPDAAARTKMEQFWKGKA
jgi:aryl-alcohol dehydrogenase-like predicted oxidoreductase